MRIEPPSTSRRINVERGAVLGMVMIVMVALMAAGGLAMYLILADSRATETTVAKRQSLYCAESGLISGRDSIVTMFASWNEMLDDDDGNDPEGYPVTGDLDGDGLDDWEVTVKDNDDEFPTSVPERDSDGAIFIMSTCIATPELPKKIVNLISVGFNGTNYRTQAGAGAGNTGNTN